MAEDPVARERSYILWLLARRDYPRKTLEKKLKDRGLAPEQIQTLLNQLEEEKIFQPASYTRVRSRSLLRRGYGANGISHKLKQDGIRESPDSVKQILESQGAQSDEGLKALIEKFRRRLKGDELPQNVIRQCLSRGHRYADVLKAWKSSVEGQED